jgi:hypothetical protein
MKPYANACGGGVGGWLDGVMNPPVTADARVRELSKYFGGQPGQAPAASTLDEKMQRARRRGC